MPPICWEIAEQTRVVNLLAYSFGLICNKAENIDEDIRKFLSDDERFVYELYNIQGSIQGCLKAIDYARRFISEYGEHEYMKDDAVPFDEFALYHYDVVCHKIATLKDLYFKFINVLYGLALTKKTCKWDNIKDSQEQIGNSELFDVLYTNYDLIKKIEQKRNKSSHEGFLFAKALDNLRLYLAVVAAQDKLPEGDRNVQYDKHSLSYKAQIESAKKKMLWEVDLVRYNAISITTRFYDSLEMPLSNKLSECIPETYKRVIEILNKQGANTCCRCPLSSFQD